MATVSLHEDPPDWTAPEIEELQGQFQNYVLLGLVGRGGMGAVYKARQISLDRLVAIKILPPHLEGGAEGYAERFANEAKALARFNHNNIVGVYDFGTTESGLLFLVMEFVSGTNVFRMIAEQGHLAPAKTLGILAAVCDGLNYAHAQGVIHRDIKPENILINAEGVVKIADFGLARLDDVHGARRSAVILGTPEYAAPEVLDSGAIIKSTADIFSLGVMLHHMLTGKAPSGQSVASPQAAPGGDPRFQAIIRRAMETDPEKRYATALEMKQELARLAMALRGPTPANKQTHPVPLPAPKKTGAPGPSGNHPQAPTLAAAKKKFPPLVIYGSAAMTLGCIIFVGFLLAGKGKTKPAPDPQPRISSQDLTNNLKVGPKQPSQNEPHPEPTPEPNIKPQEVEVVVKLEHSSEVFSFGGRQYQFIAAPISWGDAKRKAEELGGTLLCLNSPEEFEFIVEKILKPTGSVSGAIAWIGGHAIEANEWKWVSGEPCSYLPWFQSQPNVGTEPKSGSFPAWTAMGYHEKTSTWGLNDLSDSAFAHHWRDRIQGFILEKGEAPTVAETTPSDPEPVPIPVPVPTPPMPEAVPTPAPETAAVLVADGISKKLAEVETNFRKALLDAAGAAHTTANADVEKKYLAAIDRLLDAASKNGKLEESVIYQQEKQRLADQEPLPSVDDPALPPAMKPLRIALRKSLAEAQVRYDQKAKPVYDKLAAFLASLQDQLTKEQKLDDALKVKEFRETVVAELSPGKIADEVPDAAMIKPFTKPTPVPIPAETLAPPPAPKFTRELAEWITKAKAGWGYVSVIDSSGKHSEVRRGGTLPEGDFTLTVIDSANPPPPDFKAEWLVGQTKLRTLNLYETSIPDPIVLRGMTELEGLRYSTSKTDATDKTMEKFPPLPKLKYLVFYGGGCGKKTVQIIAERCPEIRQLELSGVGGNGCVQMLSLFPKLDNLLLSKIKFSAEDEKSLEHFTGLKHLKIQAGCELRPKALTALKGLRSFTALNTGKDGEDLIRAVVTLPQLTSIYFHDSQVTDDAFPLLATRPTLSSITFIACPIKGRKLAALAQLQTLKWLKLDICPVDDTAVLSLPALPSLESLTISHAGDLTDKSIEGILRMPQLQEIGLWGNSKLTDAAIEKLAAGLKAPKGLFIGGSALTDACLPHLEKMPTLETFHFDHTAITAAAIPFITSHPGLKQIHVPAKNFTEAQVAALKAAKPGLAVERK